MSNQSRISCKHSMWDQSKTSIYTLGHLRRHWEVIPLVVLQVGTIAGILFMVYHRTLVTTMDVQLGGYCRWEMPTIPRFFDLRNPRNLKLMKTDDWKPTIHLDNRYRLMRHEPMLDAQGNVTDEIGEDENAGNLNDASR